MNNEDIDKFFDELNLQLKQIRDYKQEKITKSVKELSRPRRYEETKIRR